RLHDDGYRVRAVVRDKQRALGVTRQQADPWTVDFLLNLHYLKLAEQQDVKTFMYIGVMNAATGDFDGVASKTCLHGSVGPIIGTRSNSEPLRLLLRPHRSVQRGPSRHGIRSRQWEHAALPDPRSGPCRLLPRQTF